MNDFVRPVSRLPRPIEVHLPASSSGSSNNTSQIRHGSSLPLIDLQRQPGRKKARRSSVSENRDVLHESISSRLPMPSLQDRMSVVGYRRSTPTRDRAAKRPQTSWADGPAYRHPRKTSSGKMHILKKLQTLSLGNEDKDSLSTATFARFQPLPAIDRPVSDVLRGFSSETEKKCSRTDEEQPVSSNVFASGVDFDVRRRSANFENDRPDSGVVRESLVRSRTYDIIPTGHDDWTIEEEEDGDLDEEFWPAASGGSRSRDSNGENSAARGPRLLLAIRSPSDDEEDQIYGYFYGGDRVQTILDFVDEVTGKRDADCRQLSYEDGSGEQQLLDVESIIADTAITNRMVLNIVPVIRDDRMETHNANNDETIT